MVERMKPIKCPVCRKKVARNMDGSLVMHAAKRGGLCDGTNQVKMPGKNITCTIGNVSFPVREVWIDEDGTEL